MKTIEWVDLSIASEIASYHPSKYWLYCTAENRVLSCKHQYTYTVIHSYGRLLSAAETVFCFLSYRCSSCLSGPQEAGILDYWWIFVIIACVFLFFILILICCICLFRNRGNKYDGTSEDTVIVNF